VSYLFNEKSDKLCNFISDISGKFCFFGLIVIRKKWNISKEILKVFRTLSFGILKCIVNLENTLIILTCPLTRWLISLPAFVNQGSANMEFLSQSVYIRGKSKNMVHFSKELNTMQWNSKRRGGYPNICLDSIKMFDSKKCSRSRKWLRNTSKYFWLQLTSLK
jgi:hypothetical protein